VGTEGDVTSQEVNHSHPLGAEVNVWSFTTMLCMPS